MTPRRTAPVVLTALGIAVLIPLLVASPRLPEAPVLRAVAVAPASVQLAWDFNPLSDFVDRYYVGYRTSPTGLETLVDVGNVNTWTLTTAVPGTTYIFRLFAENTTGRSGPSNEVSTTIPGGQVPAPGPQGAPIIARAPPVSATVRINFQPASAPVPTGYLADVGLVYGVRGNGQTYGWTTDNTGQARDRDSPLSPDQRYDTLNQLQRPANPDAVWELAVANGTYTVRVVAGDPVFVDSTHRLTVEGVVVVDGTPTTAAPWLDRTATVMVIDGRLTLRSAAGGLNSKVCFLEATRQ
jgi:hypothetical protein